MASVEEVSELGDISKMKVADLKKELKARGLSTTGNKLELMDRLQNGSADLLLDDNGTVDEADIIDEDAMLDDGLDDDDEDEVLTPEAEKVLEEEPKLTKSITLKRKLSTIDKSTTGQPKKIVLVRNSSLVTSEKENRQSVDSHSDDTVAPKKEEEEETSEAKKVVKLSGLSIQERLELRAQKFGPAQSNVSKKEARALRFGLGGEKGYSEPVTADKLKKRAERFGTNVSSIAMKVEQAEKLKARKERFEIKIGSSSGSLDDKKKLRAERFKSN